MDAVHRDRLPPALSGLDVLVRLRPGEEEAAAAAVDVIRERGGSPGVLIEGLPATEVFRMAGRELDTLLIHLDAAPDNLVAIAFDLKTRITGIRAGLPPDVRIGLWAPDDTLRELLERDLAPYLDFVVSRSAPGAPIPWWRAAGEMLAIRPLLDATRRDDGRSLWMSPQDPDVFARAIFDLAAAARFLPSGLIAGTGVEIECGALDLDEARGKEAGIVRPEVEVWLDPATLDHVAVVLGCRPEQVRVSPAAAAVESVALSTGDLLVKVPEPSSERFAEGVDVRAPRVLTVQEVIARHQAAAARQAATVRTRISTGTLTLTFEAPGFAAPLSISSEVVIYSDRARTEVEQRSIQVNGVTFDGGGVPKLPLVEPERVASVPLAIELTDAYEYALDGTAIVNGAACYVVRFEPRSSERTLFRGRAWIASDSFNLVKVAASQVRLRGPIISSEQVDEFTPVDKDVWLLHESRINQIYEGAAHRTPIERVLILERHEINPSDFIERRAAAYASPHVMLRDTPDGYRYLRRSRPDPAQGADGPVEIAVEDPAERVRTLAFGVIIDPNITHPLPFAGLSYVDFNLFGTGTQFNGFFGGTFGQLAFSVPSFGGSRWQLAGRAFAVASSFNDRAFVQGREQYDRNISQRPASASLWLLRPLSPRMSLRAGYDLQYTDFGRADTTDSDFSVPPAQVIHALRLALEGQRAGWNAALWWSPAIRQGWRRWGMPGAGDYRPEHRDFQRYGASLVRSAVVSPGLVLRGEASWMGGHDLDRFSRYSFGAFENPLRGYPGALIRYDRGAVMRGALAWSAAPRLRIDAFADSAFVHDPGFGDGLRRFTGIGTAVEAPAPFGVLVSAEWGYGVQARRADGGRGTHVIRVTGYKIF